MQLVDEMRMSDTRGSLAGKLVNGILHLPSQLRYEIRADEEARTIVAIVAVYANGVSIDLPINLKLFA